MLKKLILLPMLFFSVLMMSAQDVLPWENGKLMVSDEGRYLRHENVLAWRYGMAHARTPEQG